MILLVLVLKADLIGCKCAVNYLSHAVVTLIGNECLTPSALIQRFCVTIGNSRMVNISTVENIAVMKLSYHAYFNIWRFFIKSSNLLMLSNH